MPSPETTLKGISNVGDSLLGSQLKSNIITFYNWGMLGIGGFFNANIGDVAPYGGDPSRLRLVDDPNYNRGQVWEGHRQEWVWETGVAHSQQPTHVSGVWVNSSFHGIDATGTYAHHINYPEGRVVFDTAISPTSLVQANHSYRWMPFVDIDTPWFKEVMYESFRVDNSDFLTEGSGSWSQLAKTRTQLPVVGVEIIPSRRLVPYQLGGGQAVHQDIKFHVMAETDWERSQIMDIISYQNDKEVFLFDVNTITYPLDHNGTPVSDHDIYTDFVKPTGEGGSFWRKCRFIDTRSEEKSKINQSLFMGSVRTTCEVIMGMI